MHAVGLPLLPLAQLSRQARDTLSYWFACGFDLHSVADPFSKQADEAPLSYLCSFILSPFAHLLPYLLSLTSYLFFRVQACSWASALCRRLLSARHNCHWLPCGRAKRVRHIVYRAFELGLRPLPPAPLSKYSYYYEYTHVLGLLPPAADPFQHASR